MNRRKVIYDGNGFELFAIWWKKRTDSIYFGEHSIFQLIVATRSCWIALMKKWLMINWWSQLSCVSLNRKLAVSRNIPTQCAPHSMDLYKSAFAHGSTGLRRKGEKKSNDDENTFVRTSTIKYYPINFAAWLRHPTLRQQCSRMRASKIQTSPEIARENSFHICCSIIRNSNSRPIVKTFLLRFCSLNDSSENFFANYSRAMNSQWAATLKRYISD